MHDPSVVGRGMIATVIRRRGVPRGLCVLASGVSNSLETNQREFLRESALIRKAIAEFRNRKFVYFSSYTASEYGSPYEQHKFAMEQLIMKLAPRYLVVRLPQIVGVTKNNTLVSKLVRDISRGTELTIYTDATRKLLDVDDLARAVEVAPGFRNENCVTYLGPKYEVPILYVVRYIENILAKRAIVTTRRGGQRMRDPKCDELSLGDCQLTRDLASKNYFKQVLDRRVADLNQSLNSARCI